MICEHGSLKRNCPVCERDYEIDRLKCVIAEAKGSRSKSGTIARLEDRYDRLWKDFASISKVLQEIGVWTPGAGGTVVDAAYKAAVELTRLRAEVERLTPKPGHVVVHKARVNELVEEIMKTYRYQHPLFVELKKELGIE